MKRRLGALVLSLAAGACATAAPPPAPVAETSLAGVPMSPLGDDAYVDPGTPASTEQALRRALARALQRVADFYGAPASASPVIVFCGTEPCRVRFAGPRKRSYSLAPGKHAPGGAVVSRERPAIVVTRTDARAENVLAHELSHLELQSRALPGRAPTWFDEGVATAVGGEQDCANVTPPPLAQLEALVTDDQWIEWTNAPGALTPAYCGASRAVTAWLKNGGAARLQALLAGLHAGHSFESLFTSP